MGQMQRKARAMEELAGQKRIKVLAVCPMRLALLEIERRAARELHAISTRQFCLSAADRGITMWYDAHGDCIKAQAFALPLA